MFGRTKTRRVKEEATGASELASALAKDKKFRTEVISAIEHGAVARHRAARNVGALAILRRMSADAELRRELAEVATSLEKAWSRVQKKRSHRLRDASLLLGAGGAAMAAALPQPRRRIVALIRKSNDATLPASEAHSPGDESRSLSDR